MAKQSFALEAGGQKRLEVSWKGLYKNIAVALDGNAIGMIPDQKTLQKGQEFRLVDGSTIKVQLVNKFYSTELQVLRNGQPLPGSASDPETRLKNAYLMVYFIAGLNLVVGLLAFLLRVDFLQQAGFGLGSVLFGLVFVALGFFIQRRSTFALIVAIVLFAVDGLAGVALAAAAGYSPSVGGLIVRVLFLIPMIQGLGAIKMLKAAPAAGVVPPAQSA